MAVFRKWISRYRRTYFMADLSIPFLNPGRCVLLLTDETLFVYDVGAKATRLLGSIPWTAKDFDTTVSDLIAREARGKSVLILNDMVEQHYRKERVPKISPLDKANVIKRKLHAAFPAFKIRAALPLKERVAPKKLRDGKDGVEGSLYLFAAVPPSDSFLRVLDASRRSMANIAGYTLLPVEAASMVHTLSARLAKQRNARKVPVWTIFVGQHHSGGLRQIVTKNGELALTRITPVIDSDQDAEVWASEVAQEFQSTLSYLTRFGYNPDDGLDVIVIAKPDAGELLENMIDVQCNFVPMTSVQAAHLLGLSIGRQEEPRYADPLHAAWIGKKNRFMLPMQSAEMDSIAKPRQAAKYISGALVAGLLYLFYMCGTSVMALTAAQSALDVAQDQKNQIDKVYEEELARKASAGIDIKKVQASLQVFDKDQAQSLDPVGLLSTISLSLQDLRVDKIVMGLSDITVPNEDPLLTDPQVVKMPSVTLMFSFPGTLEPQKGNAQMEALKARLSKALPEYDVSLVKTLADLSYTGKIENEVGVMAQKEVAQERYTAEVLIQKKLKVKAENEGNTGS